MSNGDTEKKQLMSTLRLYEERESNVILFTNTDHHIPERLCLHPPPHLCSRCACVRACVYVHVTVCVSFPLFSLLDYAHARTCVCVCVRACVRAVSYTHLTLPTNHRV